MFEIVMDNRDGTLWDMSRIVSGMTWKTERIGKASTLEVTFVKGAPYQDRSFAFEPGNIIRVWVRGAPLFYGYVFSIEQGQGEEVKMTAYDQMRYLMTSDTYVFENTTATKVIEKIASDAELRVGYLADTRYVIPGLIEDGQQLMDIMYKALDKTLIERQEIYILYDDAGYLSLRNMTEMTVAVILGDKSMLFDYSYKRSIDSDTFNRVKVVQDNKTTGRRDVYIIQDSSTIAKWGRLQHYHKADEKMNAAQIREMIERTIELKNREQRSLSLEALGNPSVRAGCMVRIQIAELGVEQYFLVESCSHRFAGGEHTMSLELKVIG
ncbi:hypothetical protein [Paenibacillus sp. 1P07SE]|uniref:XkdQ/YqbQ family protein n=1 Tax=Paenibacillus sp. 1P07SE TaxID=3132209 RepID=UPI0039A6E703